MEVEIRIYFSFFSFLYCILKVDNFPKQKCGGPFPPTLEYQHLFSRRKGLIKVVVILYALYAKCQSVIFKEFWM